MIEFKTVNKLMLSSATTQPESSPRPSTNLMGKKIPMSDLYTDNRQFLITPNNMFQDQ